LAFLGRWGWSGYGIICEPSRVVRGMAFDPFVSIVIVNHNGHNFVDRCLDTFLKTDYPSFEIIFVDDASSDGSLEYVQTTFGSDSRLCTVATATNQGASRARNTGISRAQGAYIAFLDNDTWCHPKWLRALVDILDRNPHVGAVQCKLMVDGHEQMIGSCGHFLTPWGLPFTVGFRERDMGQHDQVTEIFGAHGAAWMVRKTVLEKVGAFDADYFIYGEETDLCWRIWLAGHKILYVPDSIVYHFFGGTLTNQSRHLVAYEGAKNSTCNLLKNLGWPNLLWMLPLHTFAWLFLAGLLRLRRGQNDARSVLKGLIWNWSNWGQISKKRRIVQQEIRTVSDTHILRCAIRLPMGQLLKKGWSWAKEL
jgi:GT2 family glycosyltransferase